MAPAWQEKTRIVTNCRARRHRQSDLVVDCLRRSSGWLSTDQRRIIRRRRAQAAGGARRNAVPAHGSRRSRHADARRRNRAIGFRRSRVPRRRTPTTGSRRGAFRRRCGSAGRHRRRPSALAQREAGRKPRARGHDPPASVRLHWRSRRARNNRGQFADRPGAQVAWALPICTGSHTFNLSGTACFRG